MNQVSRGEAVRIPIKKNTHITRRKGVGIVWQVAACAAGRDMEACILRNLDILNIPNVKRV